MAKPLPVPGVDPESAPTVNAARIIPVRVAELLAWERYVSDPDRILELHQMRIAAKRLRYTMELFATFYGPDFKDAIDKVKAIQEQLGDIHDADVMIPELLDEHRRIVGTRSKKGKFRPGSQGVDFDAAEGLLALCRRKDQERETRYRKFLASWQKLRSGRFFDLLHTQVRGDHEPPTHEKHPAETVQEPKSSPAVKELTEATIHHEGGRNGKTKTSRKPALTHHPRRSGEHDPGTGTDSGAGAGEGGLE